MCQVKELIDLVNQHKIQVLEVNGIKIIKEHVDQLLQSQSQQEPTDAELLGLIDEEGVE